jgi:hypothetical protein
MNTKMYPVEYNGKLYEKKDCDKIFTLCYESVFQLSAEGCVYFTEGLYIAPDGSTHSEY